MALSSTSPSPAWARAPQISAFNDLVEAGSSPAPGTVLRGDTHAFGNTEERAIVEVLGVPERTDDQGRAWDHSAGAGAVKRQKGSYDDALHVKRNTVVLFLASLLGGLAPAAVDHLRALSRRSIDNTEYEIDIYPTRLIDAGEPVSHRTNDRYVEYWARRHAAAAVMADARRCLKRLPGLTNQARAARVARTLPVAQE